MKEKTTFPMEPSMSHATTAASSVVGTVKLAPWRGEEILTMGGMLAGALTPLPIVTVTGADNLREREREIEERGECALCVCVPSVCPKVRL